MTEMEYQMPEYSISRYAKMTCVLFPEMNTFLAINKHDNIATHDLFMSLNISLLYSNALILAVDISNNIRIRIFKDRHGAVTIDLDANAPIIMFLANHFPSLEVGYDVLHPTFTISDPGECITFKMLFDTN